MVPIEQRSMIMDEFDFIPGEYVHQVCDALEGAQEMGFVWPFGDEELVRVVIDEYADDIWGLSDITPYEVIEVIEEARAD